MSEWSVLVRLKRTAFPNFKLWKTYSDLVNTSLLIKVPYSCAGMGSCSCLKIKTVMGCTVSFWGGGVAFVMKMSTPYPRPHFIGFGKWFCFPVFSALGAVPSSPGQMRRFLSWGCGVPYHRAVATFLWRQRGITLVSRVTEHTQYTYGWKLFLHRLEYYIWF